MPWLVESTAQRTLGREYTGLWQEWKASVRDRAELTATTVREKVLTASMPVTDRGFVTTGPSFAPAGGRIAFAAAHGDEYPGIYIAAADGSGSRKIPENVFPSSASGTGFAWDRDGSGLYFTRNEVVRNTAYYNDIYRYDLATCDNIQVNGITFSNSVPPTVEIVEGSDLVNITVKLFQANNNYYYNIL